MAKRHGRRVHVVLLVVAQLVKQLLRNDRLEVVAAAAALAIAAAAAAATVRTLGVHVVLLPFHVVNLLFVQAEQRCQVPHGRGLKEVVFGGFGEVQQSYYWSAICSVGIDCVVIKLG